VNKPSETSKKETRDSIKKELGEVQKTVETEFSYKFPETPEDLAAIKEAVFVLTKAGNHIKKSKAIHVYWKKTKLKYADDTLKMGYLFLAVNNSSKAGDFATFWEGQKVSDVLDLGMKGFLKIKNKHVECNDCEGGLWSQTYIREAAKKLLKGKHFDMVLAR
jgi:hypothetical protein